MYTYRAKKKYDVSLQYFKQAVEFLTETRVNDESYETSRHLYNKGVELHGKSLFQESLNWLRLSVDALDHAPAHPNFKEKQARTFRVIAVTYM